MTEPEIVWTRKEAMACAYCWSEFYQPEATRTDSPEQYWRGITERARQDCRRIAQARLLVAVAQGEAVAVLPPAALSQDQREAIGRLAGVKRHSRINGIINAVREALIGRGAMATENDGAAEMTEPTDRDRELLNEAEDRASKAADRELGTYAVSPFDRAVIYRREYLIGICAAREEGQREERERCARTVKMRWGTAYAACLDGDSET